MLAGQVLLQLEQLPKSLYVSLHKVDLLNFKKAHNESE
jgi:hypothetical protein